MSLNILDVHRTAHELGLKTHTTMLYGSPVETLQERIQHMIYLRELRMKRMAFRYSYL